jgi:cobalt/nickel transport system ATP-binding protein
MDEPDTSLDPRNRNNLIDLLKSLDQTLIIATCSMNFAARLCDRAVLMDKGTIIADGHAKEVMSDAILMERHGLEVPPAFTD